MPGRGDGLVERAAPTYISRGDPAARGPSRADVPARDRGARARSVPAGRHRLLRSLRYVSPIGQRLPASNGRDQLRRQQRLHRGRELSGRDLRRWDGDCGVRGLPAERRLSRQRSLHRRHLRPRRLQAQQRRRRERVRRRRPVHGRRSMHRRRLLWSVDDLRRRVRVHRRLLRRRRLRAPAGQQRVRGAERVLRGRVPARCRRRRPGVRGDRPHARPDLLHRGRRSVHGRSLRRRSVRSHPDGRPERMHAARPVLSPRGLAARRHRSPGQLSEAGRRGRRHERQPQRGTERGRRGPRWGDPGPRRPRRRSPPSGLSIRLSRLSTSTTAQQRGRVALTWLREPPGIVQKFLAAISRGRRHKDLDAPTASELRRNGRILLADTKTLKSNVKNLQRTFSVFQR